MLVLGGGAGAQLQRLVQSEESRLHCLQHGGCPGYRHPEAREEGGVGVRGCTGDFEGPGLTSVLGPLAGVLAAKEAGKWCVMWVPEEREELFCVQPARVGMSWCVGSPVSCSLEWGGEDRGDGQGPQFKMQ